MQAMNRLRNFFHRIKGSNLAQNIEMPHTKVLILAAICISVVAIALTYRVKEAKMATLTKNPYSSLAAVAGTSNQVLAADERVAAALAETQNSLLGALAKSGNPFDPNQNDSVSDRFTKDIISAYSKAQYSQNGDTEGGAGSEIDVNSALNNIDTSKLPAPRYTIKEVTIFVPQNKAQIKEFANNFAKTYLVTLAPVATNPTKYSTHLEEVGNLYNLLAANLLKVPVPSELATVHLQIVNSFALMADTFPLIDGEEKDPVKALLGLSLVQKALTELPTLFIKMSQYIKQNGILFDKTEAGSLWLGVPDALPATTASSQANNSYSIDSSE